MKTARKLRKLFDKEIESRICELQKYRPSYKVKEIQIHSKMIYNRLDEAMLVYSRLFDMTFCDVCEKFGINYNCFTQLVTNRKRNLLTLKQWLL